MLLNKNGWSLKEMLVLTAVLLLFLVVAIYYIVSLYSNFEAEVKTTNYGELEESLKKQAIIYLNDYYDDMLTNTDITITRNVLRSYDLDIVLEDSNGNSCSGYVLAHKTHGNIEATSYIKCRNYETKGYEEWRR